MTSAQLLAGTLILPLRMERFVSQELATRNWAELTDTECTRLLEAFGRYQDQLPLTCSLDVKVERLQAWATDLDAREAQLNARASLQDHRERRFRLRQQDTETELAEQRRSVGRLRQELEAQARRLAFLGDSVAEQ